MMKRIIITTTLVLILTLQMLTAQNSTTEAESKKIKLNKGNQEEDLLNNKNGSNSTYNYGSNFMDKEMRSRAELLADVESITRSVRGGHGGGGGHGHGPGRGGGAAGPIYFCGYIGSKEGYGGYGK